VKVGRLKHRADKLAASARAERLECAAHADRMLVIVRRRAGSPAGLAISFSLGFIAGSRPGKGKADHGRRAERHEAGSERGRRGVTYQLAHGPLGEAAVKLGMAFLARSLMKLQENGADHPDPPAAAAGQPAFY
jgi:hypothetical protein